MMGGGSDGIGDSYRDENMLINNDEKSKKKKKNIE